MRTILDKLQQICENATGNVYDIYYVLHKECVLNQKNPGIVLCKLFEKVQKQKFTDEGESQYVGNSEIEETEDRYFDLLEVYVHTLIRENLEEIEFYNKLYEVVFQSGIFPKDEKKQAVLLYLLAEKISGIPYFQATNLLEMTNEEYKKAVQRLAPYFEKVINILNRHFNSRTEEASQVYEILSAIEERDDKIVFLSVYTDIIRKNAVKSEADK